MRAIRWVWVGVLAVALLHLGAELLWYLGGGFGWLHAWSTSPRGIGLRAAFLYGILGLAIVTAVISHRTSKRSSR